MYILFAIFSIGFIYDTVSLVLKTYNANLVTCIYIETYA